LNEARKIKAKRLDLQTCKCDKEFFEFEKTLAGIAARKCGTKLEKWRKSCGQSWLTTRNVPKGGENITKRS
jgi:hypothetical protein